MVKDKMNTGKNSHESESGIQTPHESEMEIRTPLLLKYKMRSCYPGNEIDIDFSDRRLIGDWTSYEKRKQELWQLQLSDGDFLTDSIGNIQYFHRFEYYASGDPNPAVIAFDYYLKSDGDTIRTYELTDDCIQYNGIWCDEKIRTILLEYERQRNGWQTRIVMWRNDR